jgi:hypothetical protein
LSADKPIEKINWSVTKNDVRIYPSNQQLGNIMAGFSQAVFDGWAKTVDIKTEIYAKLQNFGCDFLLSELPQDVVKELMTAPMGVFLMDGE